jgi:hypothetical protein
VRVWCGRVGDVWGVRASERGLCAVRALLPPPLDRYAASMVTDGGMYELADLELVDEGAWGRWGFFAVESRWGVGV